MKMSSALERNIATRPKMLPNTRFRLNSSVPDNTEIIPVTAAENGIITATMLASMCFMAFVRIVQHKAELMSASKTTNNICMGLKEKTIGSMALPDGILTKFRMTEAIKERIKLVVDCTARYNVVCSFLAYIPVPAILKPYNNPARPHSISPIPKDAPENDAPLSINVLTRQTMHPRTVVILGFFLTNMYIITGTVMQERFSRNAYFAGVV